MGIPRLVVELVTRQPPFQVVNTQTTNKISKSQVVMGICTMVVLTKADRSHMHSLTWLGAPTRQNTPDKSLQHCLGYPSPLPEPWVIEQHSESSQSTQLPTLASSDAAYVCAIR